MKIETPPEPKPQAQDLPTFPKPAEREQSNESPERSTAPPQAPIGPKAEDVPKVEPPKLSPMLSQSEQRRLDALTRESFARAETNIRIARGRTLSAQQKEMIRQAENFLAQAQQLRDQDLHAARSLAERAELLSGEALK